MQCPPIPSKHSTRGTRVLTYLEVADFGKKSNAKHKWLFAPGPGRLFVQAAISDLTWVDVL